MKQRGNKESLSPLSLSLTHTHTQVHGIILIVKERNVLLKKLSVSCRETQDEKEEKMEGRHKLFKSEPSN